MDDSRSDGRSVHQPEGIRVLLVADDQLGVQDILCALQTACIDVELVQSLSALETRAVRSDLGAPDLVFLDLQFGEANWEKVVEIIQSAFSLAAVVALGNDLNGEHAARLLGRGVASLNKPVSPRALARLALRIATHAGPPSSAPGSSPTLRGTGFTGHLEEVVESYAEHRNLSKQQRLILRLYLDGRNDKEIAQTCACAEATVYEHWRRMAKKAGGSLKSDVVADFHRFLASD